MDVSIIYVNWNSVDYLRDSIKSVYENTRGMEFEIIVVDNASPKGNVDVLKEEFPGITLIKSPENLGFAGANNLGYAKSSGRYLLFLNPDTRLVSMAVNVMRDCLQSCADAGIVGCRLLNEDLSLQTSCIQQFPTILNQFLETDYLRNRWPKSKLWGIAPLFGENMEPAKVEVISGACMMVKRSAFEEVGLFSEDYFMYAEDLDLCYKITRAGYANYYVGEASVIHYGGKSSSPEWATVMKCKAVLRFCVKNRGFLYGLLFRIVMILVALGRLTILKVLSSFATMSGNKEDWDSVAVKWRAILKTLLTESGAKPATSHNRNELADCGVQQV